MIFRLPLIKSSHISPNVRSLSFRIRHGYFEEYVEGEFVLVGDDSKGIGITVDGITATTYKADVQDETVDTISSLTRVEELLDGTIPMTEGFPVSDSHSFGTAGRHSG